MDKLVTLIKDTPDYSRRVKKVRRKIREDKKKVLSIAEEYNERYSTEIAEGTKKRQLLLTEGQQQGLTEKEAEDRIRSQQGFIPTVSTPVLNWLFFFMNEYRNSSQELQRKQLNEQVGHLEHEEVTVMENTPEMFEFLYGNITMKQFTRLKKLKALSRSPNENEAFTAYRMCMKLCKKFKVDFDRIPA